jgi:hypothetical protein
MAHICEKFGLRAVRELSFSRSRGLLLSAEQRFEMLCDQHISNADEAQDFAISDDWKMADPVFRHQRQRYADRGFGRTRNNRRSHEVAYFEVLKPTFEFL